MARSLLRALPTLAAASATATHATRAGGSVCGVRTLAEGGLGADPRLAAATLRAAVCALTNLTNENPAGCTAIKDHPGGLETAAALVPWCAALEGLIPGAGPSAAERAEAEARAKGAPPGPGRREVPGPEDAAAAKRLKKPRAGRGTTCSTRRCACS